MIIFAIGFALLLNYVKNKTTYGADTIISVFSSIAIALGLAILAQTGSFNQYSSYLVGDILSITDTEILYVFLIAIVVLVFWYFTFNKLHLISINTTLAKSKNKTDLTTAELNLSNAKVKLIEAKNNYKNAKVDLNNSMYLDSQPDYNIKDTYTFAYENDFAYGSGAKNPQPFLPETFTFPVDRAVQIAYDNSPDLNVLISTKKAMEQSLAYIKKTYLPDLTADAGYGLNHTNQTNNNSFHVGVN